MSTVRIDHLYSLVADLASAREIVSSLGFQATERGVHTGRGTSNHLIVLPGAYWELLCVDMPTLPNAGLRERLLHGAGLYGCALATAGLEQDLQRARQRDLAVSAAAEFQRPVRVGGEMRAAGFRTAYLDAPQPLDASFFFCEHLTPQFVWREEWQAHPNDATGIAGLTVLADDPPLAADALARVFDAAVTGTREYRTLSAGNIHIRCVSRSQFASLYPHSIAPDGAAVLAALTFSVRSVPKLRQDLQSRDVSMRECPEGVYAQLRPLGRTAIAFVDRLDWTRWPE